MVTCGTQFSLTVPSVALNARERFARPPWCERDARPPWYAGGRRDGRGRSWSSEGACARQVRKSGMLWMNKKRTFGNKWELVWCR